MTTGMTNLAPLLLMMMVMGAAGQLAGQGLGIPRDECFPGEGVVRQTPIDPTFAPRIERFTYFLFREIARLHPGSSLIISPYSVWSVVTMAYFGALGNTQAEMENALGFSNKTHTLSNWFSIRHYMENGADEAKLIVANRGYFSQRLQVNRCLANELIDLKLVDFFHNAEATRRAINQDINVTTQGRIPELIQFMPPTTRFALVNAIFFKGSWAAEFDPKNNGKEQFLVPPGKSSGLVTMMNRVDTYKYGEAAGLNAKILELPYKGSQISMYLLLPNDPLAPLTTLTSRLNEETFVTAVRSLPQHKELISLRFPKFKLTSQYDEKLKSVLGSLGVASLFNPQRSNLNGFAVTQPPLYVDAIIHQATVEVNEEGTVAAAATAAINTRIGPQPIVVAFNRPFVFLIVDKRSQIPLFMGQVTSAADIQQV